MNSPNYSNYLQNAYGYTGQPVYGGNPTPYQTMPYQMQQPGMAQPGGYGFGGWNMWQPFTPKVSMNVSGAGAKNYLSDMNLQSWIFNGGGMIASIVNMGFQLSYQDRMMDLQQSYMNKMESLNEKYMELQGTLGEIQYKILDGKNNLMRDLARIEAKVAMYKMDKDAEVSITNTKTAAQYGYLDNKFYNHGNPAFPLG